MFNATARTLRWFVLRVSVIASFDNNPIYNQFLASSRLMGVWVKSCQGKGKKNVPASLRGRKINTIQAWLFSLLDNSITRGRCTSFTVFPTLRRENSLDALIFDEHSWLEGDPQQVIVTCQGFHFPPRSKAIITINVSLYITVTTAQWQMPLLR